MALTISNERKLNGKSKVVQNCYQSLELIGKKQVQKQTLSKMVLNLFKRLSNLLRKCGN